MTYRSFIVWGAGIVAVMLPFLLFVGLGWPGHPDSCVYDMPNTCYCEHYVLADVEGHKAGVRQPWNTWFNLYAIGTSLAVAVMMFFDRRAGDGGNVIRSMNPIADLYVFAVLFLGLGSMWFHASLIQWAGVFDNLSMHIYAAFLVFYTLRRLWPNDAAFWILWSLTVFAMVVVSAFWTWPEKSVVLIGIEVLAYLVLELIANVREKKFLMGRGLTQGLWFAAVGCIGVAILFWALSQTDKPLCFENSWFQPHGLLWHPLAGAMAVLLYFYWREEEPPAAPAVAGSGEVWS